MTLEEFLIQTRADIQAELADSSHVHEESAFTEVVMQHMANIGMAYEPQVCHYATKVGNANLKLSGYAVSEDGEELDLFVSQYAGTETVESIPDSESKRAAEQCVRFLGSCADGKLAATMDESNDAYPLALTIQDTYAKLQEIRVHVLTDRIAKSKSFAPREIAGKTVKLEVMDIQRLYRHWSEGKPRDELVVNFVDVAGAPLPCVYVPGEATDYDYALTVIPGEVMRQVYETYGARLLEANVRSFLSMTGKVNKGIRDTLRGTPEKFMAFNNGIVLVADEAALATTAEGGTGIAWLKGMQIVNGGQTTASIYFTKKKFPAETDLRRVRVPAKVIVLHNLKDEEEEALIADISRYANSQNAVKQSDLSANKPYHVALERLALTTYCPDGVGRWFYERAAGSYNTMLAREGSTPTKMKQLKETIPTSRKITKTDLAKYLNAWDQKPHLVSFGSQKNFDAFMKELTAKEDAGTLVLPDATGFKRIVAKAILFKTAQRLIRQRFQAFQANITTYTITLIANRLGLRVDLDRIWLQQALSPEFQQLIVAWAEVVNKVLHQSAGGRMISEWAKKEGCWEAIEQISCLKDQGNVPEIKNI